MLDKDVSAGIQAVTFQLLRHSDQLCWMAIALRNTKIDSVSVAKAFGPAMLVACVMLKTESRVSFSC